MAAGVEQPYGLEALGIGGAERLHWNLGPAALYEEAIRRGEGALAATGPMVCRTGHHTGRSPNDKYVVREASSERLIHWGAVNRAMEEVSFDALHRDMVRISKTEICSCLTAGRAPIRRSGCRSAW